MEGRDNRLTYFHTAVRVVIDLLHDIDRLNVCIAYFEYTFDVNTKEKTESTAVRIFGVFVRYFAQFWLSIWEQFGWNNSVQKAPIFR